MILFYTNSFSQPPGTIANLGSNYAEEYILKQQGQLFLPTNTPAGLMQHPALMGTYQLINSSNQNETNNAERIMQQQQMAAARMMGLKPPPTEADIENELNERRSGKAPALSAEQKQMKEIVYLLNDVHRREPTANDYWKTPDFATKEKPYFKALNQLKQQLLGQKPLSVADAYYDIEYAEGNTMISKQEFKTHIKMSAQFIKRWMAENKLNSNNSIAAHLAIQKFMSDTLKVGKQQLELPTAEPIEHLPFYYDYNDYKAEKDDRSYQVSKGFATGNGQCHILPLIYACLAEEMGTPFYLSYAPFHSFISYPDNSGKLHNYETTTNWSITDQWYKDNMDISSLAEKKQIYLNKMNRKQIVAAAMVDLAFTYKKKNGIADGKFINECIDFAMNYFPNKESNIAAWLMRSELTSAELDRLLRQKKITNMNQAQQLPQAKALMDKLNSINDKIASLGYTEEDNSVYEQMIEESKLKHPELINKNNLQKRNLFVPTNSSNK